MRDDRKRNLVNAERGNIVPHIVVAVAVLTAKFAGQRRKNSLCDENDSNPPFDTSSRQWLSV